MQSHSLRPLQTIIERYLRGDISAPIAAMELLLETRDVRAVERALPSLRGDPARLAELFDLFTEHSSGCSTISSLLKSGLDASHTLSSSEEALNRVRRLFDYSVTKSEEASVALYSLGSAKLLAEATNEAVDVLDAWGVLGKDRDALEIGCGIGRFLDALAPRMRSLVGTDISEKMIEVAERRVSRRTNVQARLTKGLDLSEYPPTCFHLVYSIDAFPYLVEAGRALVETHFREIFRVLVPKGDFILFNYAYGRTRESDAREVMEFANAIGYSIERVDEAPFRLWNGIGYHLKRAHDTSGRLSRR